MIVIFHISVATNHLEFEFYTSFHFKVASELSNSDENVDKICIALYARLWTKWTFCNDEDMRMDGVTQANVPSSRTE